MRTLPPRRKRHIAREVGSDVVVQGRVEVHGARRCEVEDAQQARRMEEAEDHVMDPAAAALCAFGCTVVCGVFIVLAWEWVTG